MACLISLLAALPADCKFDMTWEDSNNTDSEVLSKVSMTVTALYATACAAEDNEEIDLSQ